MKEEKTVETIAPESPKLEQMLLASVKELIAATDCPEFADHISKAIFCDQLYRFCSI